MRTTNIGYTISLTLFFAFCGLSFLNSYSDQKLSELESESIAPENLRKAAKRFNLSLAVERKSKTIDDITVSDSWLELEFRLSAYADRLEVLGAQRRYHRLVVTWMYLAAAISMAVFSFVRLFPRFKEAQQNGGEQAGSRNESIYFPDSNP